MTMLAQYRTPNKRAHLACNIHKKKSIQKRRKIREILGTQETMKPNTNGFAISFFSLISVFACLAYFR